MEIKVQDYSLTKPVKFRDATATKCRMKKTTAVDHDVFMKL